MDLPPEVLTTSMRHHQKYFSALEQADGTLANRFLVVANMAADAARDATVMAGNEQVLRARLSDAKFFWDQDRQAEAWTAVDGALTPSPFTTKLGTVATRRAHARLSPVDLAAYIPGCDADLGARRATRQGRSCDRHGR